MFRKCPCWSFDVAVHWACAELVRLLPALSIGTESWLVPMRCASQELVRRHCVWTHSLRKRSLLSAEVRRLRPDLCVEHVVSFHRLADPASSCSKWGGTEVSWGSLFWNLYTSLKAESCRLQFFKSATGEKILMMIAMILTLIMIMIMIMVITMIRMTQIHKVAIRHAPSLCITQHQKRAHLQNHYKTSISQNITNLRKFTIRFLGICKSS